MELGVHRSRPVVLRRHDDCESLGSTCHTCDFQDLPRMCDRLHSSPLGFSIRFERVRVARCHDTRDLCVEPCLLLRHVITDFVGIFCRGHRRVCIARGRRSCDVDTSRMLLDRPRRGPLHRVGSPARMLDAVYRIHHPTREHPMAVGQDRAETLTAVCLQRCSFGDVLVSFPRHDIPPLFLFHMGNKVSTAPRRATGCGILIRVVPGSVLYFEFPMVYDDRERSDQDDDDG